MYATNQHLVCNGSTEDQRAKLQKIKELTNILKDTDKNLTECEEILATYVRKRMRPFILQNGHLKYARRK